MKRLIVLAVTVISLLSLAVSSAKAGDVQTCIQTTQYGGTVGIVCGAHTPVETGLADINPVVLASVFFALAGIGLKVQKKISRAEVAL